MATNRYLVVINVITAAYSMVSILLPSFKSLARRLFSPPGSGSTYLLLTSCSAAAEVVYLAQEGDRAVSWGEVAALLCFVVLSLVSAFRVFSKFDAPGAASESKQADEQGK
ncbi:CASP-like protein 2D1 [Lolium perenne]|uniref:CASP-like protein 2D1 n=1 Tax=Lolium perenne TaxID=4522 RepID=UPI003A998132